MSIYLGDMCVSSQGIPINQLMTTIYPVGSIYLSITNTNPGTLFGGTWTSFGAGRVLVGVDPNDTDFEDAQLTGGEKTHTLVENELPALTGEIATMSSATTFNGGIIYTASGIHSPKSTTYKLGYEGRPISVKNDSGNSYTAITTQFGGGQAHNNLQPYITCYMWLRTA